MLGYFVPAFVMLAAVAGAQLAFDRVWLSMLVGAAVCLLLPVGDLQGRPLIIRLITLPKTLESRKRKRRKRHLYYSP